MNIRGCIFDLGGTIVDKYSRTPFISLKNCFQKRNVLLDDKLIFKDMGMHKLDHIKHILKDPYIRVDWKNKFGKYPEKGVDELNIFKDFNEIQRLNTTDYLDIIPETKRTIQYLHNRGIKIGTTTGFNKEITDLVTDKLNENQIYIESFVSSTCLDKPSRPEPFMIHENMKRLNLENPKRILKVDDTQVGIEEGKNAGCITVGVYRWSTYMKICDVENEYRIPRNELDLKIAESKHTLSLANPDFLIRSLDELPGIIRFLDGYK